VKSKIVWILGLLIFVACGDTERDTETQLAVPVSVAEVKLSSIKEYVTTTGNVNAIKNVLLKAESEGFYRLAKNPRTKRPFVLSDIVKKGDIIVYLDNPELENTTKIESQKLNLEISKREHEKQQSLYEKGGVTLRELKDSERAFMDAKYNYENALIQLAKLKIVASFDGIIVDLPYYTEGTKVAVNSPIVQIMNYNQLYMDVNLPAKELGKIKVKQTALVTNYEMPDDTLAGKITQVAPSLDPDSRSFKATIIVNNPRRVLRPGMFVKADIIVAQKDSAIVIPKDIILARQRGKTVFVVEKGAARERIISIGLENPEFVQVTDGLKVDERLVVKGFETLRNRSKVKIVR